MTAGRSRPNAASSASRSRRCSSSQPRSDCSSAAVLPVVYAFAGIGHAFVGWRPRVAVVVLGALAVVGYFAQQFTPLFAWPDWVNDISLYALYGTPMSKDDWGGIATLIAIGTGGTAIALFVMRRRDVGR